MGVTLRAGVVAFFISLLFFSGFARSGEPKIFLLAEPIEEEVELSRLALRAHFAGSAFISAADTALAFHAGGLGSVVGMGAYQSAMILPRVAGTTLMQLKAQSWLRENRQLSELAKAPGISGLHLVRAQESRSKGFATVALHSRFFVFAEADRDLTETDGARKWIEVDQPKAQKLRLELRMPGAVDSEYKVPALEIPLSDFIRGVPFPEPERKAWEQVLDAGQQRVSWWNRLSRRGAHEDLAVEAVLVSGKREADFGQILSGRDVARMVRGSSTWRLSNWLRVKGGAEAEPPMISARSISVEGGRCAGWFSRLLR